LMFASQIKLSFNALVHLYIHRTNPQNFSNWL
jgi:hypothetical protein